jgi:glycosyltransferase involved in cell wall biosynthesis
MATIGIVSPRSRHGLSSSTEIVAGVLAGAGHVVRCYAIRQSPPWRARFDVVIFLERIAKHWLRVASHNAVIPNPEWFFDEYVDMLDDIEVVFAKTHDAVSAFERLGCTVVHTGFTSRDNWLPDVEPDPKRWLHLAGQSEQKGTKTVVDVWAANPDFPELTIVQSPSPPSTTRPMPTNVRLLDDYLPGPVVQALQNESAVHLCPSEAEGWGHYLVEGLAVGAVVLTTDAPPMNEIVRPNRGILCPYGASEPQRLGTNYYVSAEALEATVRSTLDLGANQLATLGRNARAFYVQNHHDFVGRLTAAVEGLLGKNQLNQTAH